ncbi:MAG TPA: DUF1801 domain-containing protein [Planctomycetota bacterium]|nr:DUF1801 domain-containing protein [Planctomycetota bacterium]
MAARRRTDPDVDAFLRGLEHPLAKELAALRRLFLGASAQVCEGIKWNSPSFRVADWFATINVCGAGRPPRPADPPSLRIVLHTGAKAKGAVSKAGRVADPEGLLQWLGNDRCLVTITSAKDLAAKRTALRRIVRAWIGTP